MGSANFLFIMLMLIGPIVSISSNNWVICWGGMELSFMALIPLLFWGNKYFSLTKESAMKYFCIQALGSGLLFISGLVLFFDYGSPSIYCLIVLSIFVKLGVFPAHFWVPSVVAGLDWFSLLAVLTIQKVAPYAFLILVCNNCGETMSFVICILAAMTAVVGALIGNNQTDLRAMLGASSIGHSGWLVLGCVTGYMWSYFILYCVSLMFTVFLIINMKHSSEVGVAVLSLSGLPPFFMFLGKWGVLMSATIFGIPLWLIGVFLLSAVLSLNFYLKFSYSFMLNNNGFWSWSENGNDLTVLFLFISSMLFVLFLVL